MTNPLRAAMSAGYAARTEEFPTCLPENGIPGGPRESGKRKEQSLLAVASGAENGSVRGQNRMSRRTKPLPGVQSGPSQAADHFDVDGASCGVDPETESYFAVR